MVHTSDHGHLMGEHRLLNKAVQYEPAVQAPLIMQVPALAPTLLELLGQRLPAHLQGTSLVPLLAGGDIAPEEGEVFIEWNGPPSENTGVGEDEQWEARTIRRGRWKLNVNLSSEHELYDLQQDSGEEHNAFHDPGRGQIIAALYERLRRWQQDTNDGLTLPEPLAG